MKRSGASLFFKCEKLSEDGAFKARGATKRFFVLDDATAKRGVANAFIRKSWNCTGAARQN